MTDPYYTVSVSNVLTVTVGAQPTVSPSATAQYTTVPTKVTDRFTLTLTTNPATAVAPVGPVQFGMNDASGGNYGPYTASQLKATSIPGVYTAYADVSIQKAGTYSTHFSFDGSPVYPALLLKAPQLSVVNGGIAYIAVDADKTTVDPATTVNLRANINILPALGPALTGSVAFLDGTTTLGTVTGLSPAQTAGAYIATLPVTFLTAGIHNITAVYSGDTNYSQTTSQSLSVTVNNVAIAAASADKPSLTLSSGSSTGNTVNVTFTSYNGLTGTFPVACTIAGSTSVYPPTCSVTPSSATLAASGTRSTAIVTVAVLSTTAKADLVTPVTLWRSRLPVFAWIPVSLLLVTWRRRGGISTLLAILLVVGVGGVAGCSGGGGTSSSAGTGSGGSGSSTGSSAGTYSLKVTAAVNNSSTTVSIPVTIN